MTVIVEESVAEGLSRAARQRAAAWESETFLQALERARASAADGDVDHARSVLRTAERLYHDVPGAEPLELKLAGHPVTLHVHVAA